MAGRYGMTFAAELIEQGNYEEAIEAATKAMEGGDKGPEPHSDRATALDFLERYAEATTELERAIELNSAERCLDPDGLDDAYFSALVAAAKLDAETSVAAGVQRLERYVRTVPQGRHVRDAEDWRKRLRGEMPSLLDKTTEM